jgi:uncharacterized membrane protein
LNHMVKGSTRLRRIAPMQLMVIGFLNPDFPDHLIAEIDKLRDSNLIRVVDALAVDKDDNGEISILTETDLICGKTLAYETIISWLLEIDGDDQIAKDTSLSAAMVVESELEYGINQQVVTEIIDDIPKGAAAAFLLIEHLWVLPIKDAVRDSRGVVIAQDFINPDMMAAIGDRVFSWENKFKEL